MSAMQIDELLESLTQKAREASIAEQEFDRDIARRRAEITEARAFAWRRVSLLRAIAAEIGRRHAVEEPEAVLAAGRRCFLRELGWSGTGDNQREVADHFQPVLEAIRATLDETLPTDAHEIGAAFEKFEAWYLQSRQASFLSLMQRDIVELPLVEV